MSKVDDSRAIAIREITKILEKQNDNSAFLDAREIWLLVIKPLLEIEGDYWIERFNGRSTDQH